MAFPGKGNATYQGRITALAKALEAVQIGQMITYGQITRALGVPFPGPNGGENRHYFYAARKLARRTGCWFNVVPNEGYQRPPDEAVPGHGVKTRRHVRKTTRESIYTITAVVTHSPSMSNSFRIEAQKEVALLGMLNFLARDSVKDQLPEVKVRQAKSPAEQMRETMETILGRKIED